jgi:hypothetical protein
MKALSTTAMATGAATLFALLASGCSLDATGLDGANDSEDGSVGTEAGGSEAGGSTEASPLDARMASTDGSLTDNQQPSEGSIGNNDSSREADSTDPTTHPDANQPDTPLIDATHPDANRPDANRSDANHLDANLRDVSSADAGPPDSNRNASDGSNDNLPDGAGIIPTECRSCLATSCTSSYDSCLDDVSCSSIVDCDVTCFKGGGEAKECASNCLAGSNSDTGPERAKTLGECADFDCPQCAALGSL